jgi:hypothetical protein
MGSDADKKALREKGNGNRWDKIILTRSVDNPITMT